MPLFYVQAWFSGVGMMCSVYRGGGTGIYLPVLVSIIWLPSPTHERPSLQEKT